MTINPFIKPAPRAEGTVYGVYFNYSNETDEYLLEDGNRFIRYEEMVAYVQKHLRTLNPNSPNAGQLLAELPTPLQRRAVEEANRITQEKWNREFNKKVLSIVREVIERGEVTIAYLEAQSIDVTSFNDPPTYVVGKMDKAYIRITMPRAATEIEAYTKLRTTVEAAVRRITPPPHLREIS